MKKPFCLLVLIAGVLVFTSILPGQEDPPKSPDPPAEGDAQAPEKEPEFKKPASKEDYKKGRSLYDQGKFKEAEALLKKAKADAKENADKETVEKWLQAATGAQLLEKCKQRAQQKQVQQAFTEVESYLRRYQGTPIEGAFKALYQELEAKLYIVIENFDSPSAEYSEKFGKTFVSDPKLTLDGTACLQWASTKDRKDAALKIKGVPSDWSKIDAMELWVNVQQSPGSPEIILQCGEATDTKAKKPAPKKKKKTEVNDFYRTQIRMPGQAGKWTKIRIPMAEFQPQGQPSFTAISAVQIQIAGGRQYSFLIDKVTLLRKDPVAGGEDAKKKK